MRPEQDYHDAFNNVIRAIDDLLWEGEMRGVPGDVRKFDPLTPTEQDTNLITYYYRHKSPYYAGYPDLDAKLKRFYNFQTQLEGIISKYPRDGVDGYGLQEILDLRRHFRKIGRPCYV